MLLALSPSDIPRLDQVRINLSVLGWTLLVSLGSGLLAGLVPAWQASGAELNDALKQGGRGTSELPGRRRLRSTLVVSEIALALMLLISAGLLIKSFIRLQQVDPGFRAQQALTMEIPLPRIAYPEPTQVIAFQQRMLERLRALPGVQSAALASSLPPNDLAWRDNYMVEGEAPLPDAKLPSAAMLIVSPDYFRSLGIPLLQGRSFTEADIRDGAPVTIISETLARRSFPNQNPIGKRFKVGGIERPTNPWSEIIGVVADVKYEGLGAAPLPAFYESALQRSYRGMYLVINFSGDTTAVTNAIRREVRALDPQLPVANVRTVKRLLEQSVAQPRFRTMLIGSFSAAALLLAAIGIYGVMAYSVTQRTQEIGVRMALGAQTRDILQLVLRQGLVLTAVGIAAGLIGALAATRLIGSLLFEVPTNDVVTFAAVSLLLAAVALLACIVPARRAASVNPLIALNRS
jgi:putative ABC transport system permease protein